MRRDRHTTDYLLWVEVGPGQHFRHAFFRGHDNGQTVRPAVLDKQPPQIFLGIWSQKPRPLRSLQGDGVLFPIGQWAGEGIENFRHQRLAGYRVVSLYILMMGLFRYPRGGMGWVTETQLHAMYLTVPRHVVSEVGSGDRGRRDTCVFYCPGKFGETRRTTVSGTYAEDSGVSLLLDLLPKDRVVGKGIALFAL